MSKIKNKLKKFFKTAFVSAIIARLIFYYVKFVAWSIRWQDNGIDGVYNEWKKANSIIITGWHGRILMLPHFWNGRDKINALVSLHRDGRLIAALLKKFGMGVIDGSTNINPQLAAINLMRTLHAEESVAIIPDGPRGPRMKMTMSPIYFAHKTGKPIIGITYSTQKACIAEKAWDKMMLPMPFSKGIFMVTKPFYVPIDAAPEELDGYMIKLEEELNKLTYDADIAMGRTPILPDETKKRRKV